MSLSAHFQQKGAYEADSASELSPGNASLHAAECGALQRAECGEQLTLPGATFGNPDAKSWFWAAPQCRPRCVIGAVSLRRRLRAFSTLLSLLPRCSRRVNVDMPRPTVPQIPLEMRKLERRRRESDVVDAKLAVDLATAQTYDENVFLFLPNIIGEILSFVRFVAYSNNIRKVTLA